MKIFHVFNPKRGAFAAWILTTDADRAILLAKNCLKSKTLVAEDVTQRFLDNKEPNIPELIQSGVQGRLVKQIKTLSFRDMIAEIQSGVQRDPQDGCKWICCEYK